MKITIEHESLNLVTEDPNIAIQTILTIVNKNKEPERPKTNPDGFMLFGNENDILSPDEKPITDEMLEKAYMGEHPCIQPADTPQKSLTIKEKIFYDYIKNHPGYTMAKTCRALGISEPEYYQFKQRLKKKGWPVQGVVDFAK
jgi:hypothetical protein